MFQNRPNYSYIYASRGFSATAELFVSETDVSPYDVCWINPRLIRVSLYDDGPGICSTQSRHEAGRPISVKFKVDVISFAVDNQ